MRANAKALPELRSGDKMSRDEFLRRWEAMPDLKRAELIGGVVYLSSPMIHGWNRTDARGDGLERLPTLETGETLSQDEFLRRWAAIPNLKYAELIAGVVFLLEAPELDEQDTVNQLSTLLADYIAVTEGADAGSITTWKMLQDAPQMDCHVRLEERCGGHSCVVENYRQGAPELAVEVCGSSTSFDLHQKLALYELAGVDEYFVVLMWEQEVRWFQREQGRLEQREIPPDGIVRSRMFPGLWLDTRAILDRESRRALDVVKQGIASTEHEQFVNQLAARRILK